MDRCRVRCDPVLSPRGCEGPLLVPTCKVVVVSHWFPVPSTSSGCHTHGALPDTGAQHWVALLRSLGVPVHHIPCGWCFVSRKTIGGVCFREDNVGLVGHPVYPSLSTHVTKVSFCVDLYKTESSIKIVAVIILLLLSCFLSAAMNN